MNEAASTTSLRAAEDASILAVIDRILHKQESTIEGAAEAAAEEGAFEVATGGIAEVAGASPEAGIAYDDNDNNHHATIQESIEVSTINIPNNHTTTPKPIDRIEPPMKEDDEHNKKENHCNSSITTKTNSMISAIQNRRMMRLGNAPTSPIVNSQQAINIDSSNVDTDIKIQDHDNRTNCTSPARNATSPTTSPTTTATKAMPFRNNYNHSSNDTAPPPPPPTSTMLSQPASPITPATSNSGTSRSTVSQSYPSDPSSHHDTSCPTRSVTSCQSCGPAASTDDCKDDETSIYGVVRNVVADEVNENRQENGDVDSNGNKQQTIESNVQVKYVMDDKVEDDIKEEVDNELMEVEEEIVVYYNNGATPLFLAIEERDWDTVSEVLRKNPEQAAIWVESTGTVSTTFNWSLWKRLPLHEMVRRQPPADMVSLLLHIYPPACTCTTPLGEIPLHLAIEYGASLHVVTALIATYWTGIFCENQMGHTPFDLLRDNDPLLDTVEYNKVFTILTEATQLYTQIQSDHANAIDNLQKQHARGLYAVQKQHDTDLLQEQQQQDKLLQDIRTLQMILSTQCQQLQQNDLQIQQLQEQYASLYSEKNTVTLEKNEYKKHTIHCYNRIDVLEDKIDQKDMELYTAKNELEEMKCKIQDIQLQFSNSILQEQLYHTQNQLNQTIQQFNNLSLSLNNYDTTLSNTFGHDTNHNNNNAGGINTTTTINNAAVPTATCPSEQRQQQHLQQVDIVQTAAATAKTSVSRSNNKYYTRTYNNTTNETKLRQEEEEKKQNTDDNDDENNSIASTGSMSSILDDDEDDDTNNYALLQTAKAAAEESIIATST